MEQCAVAILQLIGDETLRNAFIPKWQGFLHFSKNIELLSVFEMRIGEGSDEIGTAELFLRYPVSANLRSRTEHVFRHGATTSDGLIAFDWTELAAEKAEYLVYFVHAKGGFALLQLADKPQADTGFLGQFRLGEAGTVALMFDKFAEMHIYTLKGTNIDKLPNNVPFRVYYESKNL